MYPLAKAIIATFTAAALSHNPADLWLGYLSGIIREALVGILDQLVGDLKEPADCSLAHAGFLGSVLNKELGRGCQIGTDGIAGSAVYLRRLCRPAVVSG